MKIIGLSGTNGSGKDTVGHMLADRYKFLFISVSDMLRDEARSRGQEPTREVLRSISAEWRRDSGNLGVIIDKAIGQYQRVATDYPGGLVLASLRNPGEAERIHQLDGFVVWVDADSRLRYDRIQANKQARGDRLGEDERTYEEFLAEEVAEMYSYGDETTLDMAAVKQRSDIEILNNGQDINEFMDQADKQLEQILGNWQ